MDKQEVEMVKDSLIGHIKRMTEQCSSLAVELDWNEVMSKKEYSSEDLFNASLLFFHIFWNISAHHCMVAKKMTMEQAWAIAMELWENMRQTVLLGTWIDTHALTERLMNKK